MPLRRYGPVRRAVCSALIVSLTGCTTLRPVAAPQQFIPVEQPTQIWLTRPDSTKLLIEGPRFVNDTLVGFVRGEYREFAPGDLREVRVRQPAPRRTAFLVGTAVALGAVLISVLASSGPGGGGYQNEDPSNPSSSLRFYFLGRK